MRAALPLLDATFDSLPVAIVHTNADRVIVAVNAAAEVLLGWPREELVGRSTEVLHADRAGFEATGAAYLNPRAPVDVARFESLCRRRDGSTFWESFHTRILRDADGCALGFVGTLLDVTESRRWAARRELLGRMGELSASLDPAMRIAAAARVALPEFAEGTIVYLVEPDGEVSLGAVEHVDPAQVPIIRASFARGGLPRDAPHGYRRVLRDGVTELVAQIDEAFLTRSARDEGHLAILRASQLRSAVTVPLTVDDRPIGALMLWRTRDDPFTAEDVVLAEELGRRVAVALEHARLYRSEREARAAAEEAARAKDEFLAVLSHELRTPLNAVLGWTRVLARGGLDPERGARAIATIERNALAQARLVEDLIDISRISAGKLELAEGEVDLARVVQDVVDSMTPAAAVRSVALLLAPTGPVWIPGDAARLRQVAENLVANAIKFTEPGGRVAIALGGDDQRVELTVADSGAGIPAAFLPHLFERFRQADTGAARRHGGLGIGLSVARHLIALHGGEISASSDGLGRGAQFVVRLPRRAGAPGLSPEAAVEGGTAGAASLTGLDVLVVDDDGDARELARWILSEEGAHVDVAVDAASAMRAFDAHVPDVLISDIAMPDEDGYALLRRIRARGAEEGGATPAIAVTAYASPDDRARSRAAGFDVHLAKPIEAADLVRSVQRLAGRRLSEA